MGMGHGVENRQGMWKEGEGAFPPAQTDVWSGPVLARGLLHVQPIPWQEQPSSCRQFIVSLFPLTPKVPRSYPAIKPRCASHASAWFRIPATAGLGIESRKLPARVLHARTRQSHRTIPHLPSRSKHPGLMSTDMPRAQTCHGPSSYHSGGLSFPDKFPTSGIISHPYARKLLAYEYRHWPDRRNVRRADFCAGNPASNLFSVTLDRRRRARCASAPGAPHHRTTLPKVDSRASVLGSSQRCTRILLGER